MREIKFRLILNGRIVGYEKWYPGQGKPEDITSAKPQWMYSKDGKYWNPTYIVHAHKDQFTGLKDKSGTPIYEGDVIRWRDEISQVEWNHRFAQFRLTGPSVTAFPAILESMVEVIGNIHQDSHLLEHKHLLGE